MTKITSIDRQRQSYFIATILWDHRSPFIQFFLIVTTLILFSSRAFKSVFLYVLQERLKLYREWKSSVPHIQFSCFILNVLFRASKMHLQ